ncbi:MAG: thioredoxin family protein [Neomegalonema sp.]|nr:thioredoxin family protein [Neomegalonema sp.]
MRTVFTTLIAALIGALAMVAAGQAQTLGEDGLHKTPWMAITFKDMTEDLQSASEQGKRLAIIFEQRGCIYCKKMHEEVFPDPKIAQYISENFMVVQMNLFGDEEVTDFDGESLSEKEMARRWGVVFTPTLMFMPEEVPESGTAAQAAVSVMPGAFGKFTTRAMFQWVKEKGYEGDEHFQKYLARMIAEQK